MTFSSDPLVTVILALVIQSRQFVLGTDTEVSVKVSDVPSSASGVFFVRVIVPSVIIGVIVGEGWVNGNGRDCGEEEKTRTDRRTSPRIQTKIVILMREKKIFLLIPLP